MTWPLAATQHELTAEERELVANVLRHFDRQRYDLVAYVVMNDHVHVLVTPLGPWALQQLVHGWKSFSTHQLRQICGRSQVWQSEYFLQWRQASAPAAAASFADTHPAVLRQMIYEGQVDAYGAIPGLMNGRPVRDSPSSSI